MQSDLLKLLPQFDVISFDVFDTLLLRPYLKPTDLFRKVAGKTFREERIAGERAAYAARSSSAPYRGTNSMGDARGRVIPSLEPAAVWRTLCELFEGVRSEE